MITYYKAASHDTRLNQIVIAGSHDAGITGGGANAQTQSLDIGGQARAGVRFFDLRIAAEGSGQEIGGHKVAELKAFHADDKLTKNSLWKGTSIVKDAGPQKIKTTTMLAGTFGMGLGKMLRDAREFVQSREGSTEFLILKFDKSTNWPQIAKICVSELGDAIFKGAFNLNTAPIGALQGKVIVLFAPKGVSTVAAEYGPRQGILGWKNLSKEGAGVYDPMFSGLQYYGGGGTNPLKIWQDKEAKLKDNQKKQGKLMEEAKALKNPNIMGMMYWTTTGLLESIRERDQSMWTPPNRAKMKQLWKQGLGEFVEFHNPYVVPEGSPAVGPLRKRFMPNIVMMDFADEEKCKVVRELNDLSPDQIALL